MRFFSSSIVYRQRKKIIVKIIRPCCLFFQKRNLSSTQVRYCVNLVVKGYEKQGKNDNSLDMILRQRIRIYFSFEDHQ